MDKPEPLEEIPANELISVFSHAMGVHFKLDKIATENGLFDSESFDAIGKELNWLKESLEKVAPYSTKLPPTIASPVEAIVGILNDASCNISYADVCKDLWQSKLDENGRAGWKEVLRLTRKPAISWVPATADRIRSHSTTGANSKRSAAKDKPKQRVTVNDRMIAEMASNLEEVKGWTAKEWADRLNCGQTTIKDTETWKTLALLRQQAKAEKQKDRRRR